MQAVLLYWLAASAHWRLLPGDPLLCAPRGDDRHSLMFFEITQRKNIRLHPRNFGAKLREELLKTLMKEVAGTCTQRYGYVIAVTEVKDSGKGLIQEGTGHAVFPVTFTCIVMRPFKGEVFEAVVTNVTRMGIYAEIGPMVVLVSSQQMPATVSFDEHSQAAQFVNSDDDSQITIGSEVSRIVSSVGVGHYGKLF